MQRLRYLILIILVCSCSSYPEAIKDVLRQAGSNRKELEKVLKHYRKNPSDSLKLRAAEFLIANMPGKYSECYYAQWNDVATAMLRWTSSSDKRLVAETYKLGEPVRKDDLTHITAEYLINNIELAFKVWQEMPWGKHIPFDVFCEEILPHRVSTEPLENWREKVLASFADIYNSFMEDTSITTVEACSKVNDLLPRFRMDKDFHSMNYSQLMASSRGLCDEMAALGVFVMRGLGIPVTLDFAPVLPYGLTGHSRNSVRDSNGLHHSFLGAETNPDISSSTHLHKACRVFRNVYANQQIIFDKNKIPPLLQNINNVVDVTSEYGPCFDIWLPIPKDYSPQNGTVYLAIIDEMAWQPITLGVVNDYSLDFNSMKNGLYLPVYYHIGIQTPAGYPFSIKYNTVRHFQPFSSHSISLTSIAPGVDELLYQMKGGKFEVANRSDFSDAKTIHTIETSGLGYHTVSVKNMKSYRYIRYIPPVGERCNVSILEFYDENNEKLEGAAIGTSGVDAESNIDKVFDGDVDTYFEAVLERSWVGLDLGEPKKITKIRYLPRSNGNGIYEGHVYELFYWNWNKWKSLGRKTADSRVLQYEAPDNALFYLKNVTKSRMYKTPFSIEKRAQHWF